MEGLQKIEIWPKILIGSDSWNNPFGASVRFVSTGSHISSFGTVFGHMFSQIYFKITGRVAKK